MREPCGGRPIQKHPALVVWEEVPLNAETPLELLRRGFVTPQELFFVRNHGRVPDVNPDRYRVSIGGTVKAPLTLSMAEIRERFRKQTVVATLQCAGNRRADLMRVAPIPGEVPWDAGAIGNAVWGGAPLGEILKAAGLPADARHVAFVGLDEIELAGQRINFGGSIPLEKALSPEVLLAYEMNGEPLGPAHGFPLRVVAPGYIGARSVKWLAQVTVQAHASTNYYQTHAYKIFPSSVRGETADWSRGLTLGETPVNAVICRPGDGETVPAGPVHAEGYAVAGGDRRITRVELSVDGGRTWGAADLGMEEHPWAWRFWEARLDLSPGRNEIVARAWDSAANTQPEDVRKVWNFKGYVNCAWHRVTVHVAG
jgi:sulfite oxidase